MKIKKSSILSRPSPGIGCLCDNSLCNFGGDKK